MKKVMQLCLLLSALLSLAALTALAQAPTGTISGTVMDESGAVVPNAEVTITDKGTGAARQLKSDAGGNFTAPSLPAGEYEVKVVVAGFRTVVRDATVLTGSTTTVDMRMQVGQSKDVVTVEAATAQVEYERHSIDGVITRQKIQELPLNGRSFLNLAFLEPGVTVGTGTTSQYNSLFSVSVLGSPSGRTAISVDGGNIRNSIEGNTGMNFSQEVVQEFQLSSVNFDLSTGITSVGSVNIVTRSGSNDFHGSAYFFFRDHNMSAYPALVRNPLTPDPFFVRRNPGFWVGGPVVKNRMFFFFNYEYTKQTQVFALAPNQPSVASFLGVYPSPYKGKNLSAKFDYNLSTKHHLIARYSHDGNSGFGPNGGAQPPSNWLRNTNWSDQSLLGLTSTLSSRLVNDFRVSYQYWQNRNLFPDESRCPGCVGLNFPPVSITGTNITVGNTSNATQGRDLRKFQFLDTLNWQKGSHGLKFGFEFEHAPGTGFWGFCDPACLGILSPEYLRGLLGPAGSAAIPLFYPTMPSAIRTNDDILNSPWGPGGVIGIGDPSQPPPYNVDKAKVNNRVRFFAQDQWRVKPRFTLSYGLAWNFESTLNNPDLDKPKYLAPLYGSDLSATRKNYKNFSPMLGFNWGVDKTGKTVIRGGGGIYYDTEVLWQRLTERASIGPIGNGRIQYPALALTNIFPNLVDVARGGTPIPVGTPLSNTLLPNLTLRQYLQIMQQQLPALTASLAPKNLNDLSVRGIERSKSAADLYPRDYPVQKGLHMSIGLQRQLPHDMVLSVDYVRSSFTNVLIGSLDYNRFNRFVNGVRSPVIPECTAAQRNIDGFNCSTGAITFWTPGGRQDYNAMLLKLDKRFSKRYLFTLSYALQDRKGLNSILNLDNWFDSYGPQGARHILNVSGIVELPWGFQLGVISQSSSRGPIGITSAGNDLDGEGNTTEWLSRPN
jgi:hypothetical protein